MPDVSPWIGHQIMTMRSIRVVLAALLFAVGILFAGPCSAQTHPVGTAPSVEFSPAPVTGALAGLAQLNLVFRTRPSSAEAQRLVRLWLGSVLVAYGRAHDINATAWYSPTGKQIDEETIDLEEGNALSSTLVFTAKTNSVHFLDKNWWPEKK